jgi:hypothetical protein
MLIYSGSTLPTEGRTAEDEHYVTSRHDDGTGHASAQMQQHANRVHLTTADDEGIPSTDQREQQPVEDHGNQVTWEAHIAFGADNKDIHGNARQNAGQLRHMKVHMDHERHSADYRQSKGAHTSLADYRHLTDLRCTAEAQQAQRHSTATQHNRHSADYRHDGQASQAGTVDRSMRSTCSHSSHKLRRMDGEEGGGRSCHVR